MSISFTEESLWKTGMSGLFNPIRYINSLIRATEPAITVQGALKFQFSRAVVCLLRSPIAMCPGESDTWRGYLHRGR
jgi:hypothetical protein